MKDCDLERGDYGYELVGSTLKWERQGTSPQDEREWNFATLRCCRRTKEGAAGSFMLVKSGVLCYEDDRECEPLVQASYKEYLATSLPRPRRVTAAEGFAGQESQLRLALRHLTEAVAELEAFPDMDTGEGDSACCNLRQAVECISESLGDMDG